MKNWGIIGGVAAAVAAGMYVLWGPITDRKRRRRGTGRRGAAGGAAGSPRASESRENRPKRALCGALRLPPGRALAAGDAPVFPANAKDFFSLKIEFWSTSCLET